MNEQRDQQCMPGDSPNPGNLVETPDAAQPAHIVQETPVEGRGDAVEESSED